MCVEEREEPDAGQDGEGVRLFILNINFSKYTLILLNHVNILLF